MKVSIPESWSDVKLVDYLYYWKNIKPYVKMENNEEFSVLAIQKAIQHLCKVDPEVMKNMDTDSAVMLHNEMGKLLAVTTTLPLCKTFTIEIDGKPTMFGFEPNLDDMSYGCYLDLAESCKDVWENIWVFLATLYRPVTTRFGERYRIEEYEGTDFSVIPRLQNAMTMDIVFGAVGFFLNLQNELLSDTLNYTAKVVKKEEARSRRLGKFFPLTGEASVALSSSLTTMSQKLTQLLGSTSTFVFKPLPTSQSEPKLKNEN